MGVPSVTRVRDRREASGVGELGEVHHVERVDDLLAAGGGRHTAHLEAERHVLPDRHVREQRVLMEHHADVPLVDR
ncbi:hypothetical protein, partial [Curtobacterium sp. B18]|uniref:hypothetical protein n=1 Tax=Curtobacterium sp. B18 TaxID=95614 RepID=UPI001650E0D2